MSPLQESNLFTPLVLLSGELCVSVHLQSALQALHVIILARL